MRVRCNAGVPDDLSVYDLCVYDHADTAAIIRMALEEDLRGRGDVTCQALVPAGSTLTGTVRAKAPGVVCGLPLFARVFAALGGGVEVTRAADDGTRVAPGDIVLGCRGDAAVMLQGERTALNLCQRLSGTATMAARFVAAVAGTRARILDTRKTTPGLRLLQKHAVRAGGADNHRIGLYDQVLIKDNHIALMAAAGGPAEAVRRCRARAGTVVIEVEIERVEDLEAVVAAGADIVLLDNMASAQLRAAVTVGDRLRAAGASFLLEASGGITLANVAAVAATGVDRISTGELTHSVQSLDLSLRCVV